MKNKWNYLALPDNSDYLKSIAINTVWYFGKDELLNQWNENDSSGTAPSIYWNLFYEKVGMAELWGQRDFSIKGIEQ